MLYGGLSVPNAFVTPLRIVHTATASQPLTVRLKLKSELGGTVAYPAGTSALTVVSVLDVFNVKQRDNTPAKSLFMER